jgi:hypothetical protein
VVKTLRQLLDFITNYFCFKELLVLYDIFRLPVNHPCFQNNFGLDNAKATLYTTEGGFWFIEIKIQSQEISSPGKNPAKKSRLRVKIL